MFYWLPLMIIIIYLINLYEIFEYEPYIEAQYGLAEITDDYVYPTIIDNFVTEEEAKYVIELAREKFIPSVLFGNYRMDNIRNSKSIWLPTHDKTISSIIQRACTKVGFPFKNAEGLQVVKYDPNGYFKPHYDTTHEIEKQSHDFFSHGGHRLATIIVYLNDEFEGGNTHFVNLQKHIKPKKYGGILFYSLDKKGNKCHPNSLHEGTKVLSGNKYIANIWIRQNKFI